mgnify:CR=1 FL=1
MSVPKRCGLFAHAESLLCCACRLYDYALGPLTAHSTTAHMAFAPAPPPPLCLLQSFLFDGRDYEFEVLDGLAAAVEEAAAARAAKAARATNNRRLSLAPPPSPAPTPSSSIASRLPAGTPLRKSFAAGASSSSSGAVTGARGSGLPRPASAGVGGPGAASPAPRRAGGPSTPMPLRGVSNCSLRERHSICVVR